MSTLPYNRLLVVGALVTLCLFGHVGKLWAPTGSCGVCRQALHACYDRLMSPNFASANSRDQKHFEQLHQSLLENVSAMLGSDNDPSSKHFLSLQEHYDAIDDILSRDDSPVPLTSAGKKILDECYDAVHPEAPDVE